MSDRIIIHDLRVMSRVGVTSRERRRPQRILVCIEIPLSLKKAGRSDRLEDTIDYQAVSKVVDRVARSRPRRLVERLAADIGREVAKIFGAKRVKVLVKKFIVKQAGYVGVKATINR